MLILYVKITRIIIQINHYFTISRFLKLFLGHKENQNRKRYNIDTFMKNWINVNNDNRAQWSIKYIIITLLVGLKKNMKVFYT